MSEPVSYKKARRLVKQDSSIRAAVITAHEVPLVESSTCLVRLFHFVKDADDFFRERRQALLDAGFEVTRGTVGRGLLIFEHPDGRLRGIALDKR